MKKFNPQGKLSKVETLSAKEIKAYVIRARGYTTREYNKEYDLLRNRVRNYERLTGASKIAVNKLLYSIVRAEVYAAKEGKPVNYTQEQRNVLSTTSANVKSTLSQRAQKQALKQVLGSGIEVNPIAYDIKTRQPSLYKVNIDNLSLGAFSQLVKLSKMARNKFQLWVNDYYNTNGTLPTAVEVNTFLSSAADQLHELQKLMASNRGEYYRRKGTKPGSP